MALFSKFFGKTISESAAFALGGAMRSPLEPPLTELTNQTWARFVDEGITIPTDAGDAAEIAAEDVASEEWAKDQAKQRGIGGDQMDKLIRAYRVAPAFGTLLELLRRKIIDPALFQHGIDKGRYEPVWGDKLAQLARRLLDLAPVADGIQRGLVNPPFGLPYTPPGSGGQIPAFPPSNLDAQAIAEGLGFTLDDLYLLTALAGNPPGPQALYRARFREAINDVDVQRGLAEGRSRQEWAPAFEADARAIPSATDFVEKRLRGWTDDAGMYAGTARHGMTQDDTDTLFLIHGRPLTWHQIFIGLRRGGVYDGPTGHIPAPILKAMQESNLRPEWYNPAYAAIETYPSTFVLRSMAQSGDLTEAETLQILLYEGWNQPLAERVAAKWTETTGATKQDPAVKSAETKFVTAIHKATVGGAITEAQAVEQLALTSYTPAVQADVLAYFMKEKALNAIKPPAA